MPIYLDENGEPIRSTPAAPSGPTYLDDNGEPIASSRSYLSRAGDFASRVGNEALGFVKGAGHTAQNVMAMGLVDPLLGPGASQLARANAPYAAPALAPGKNQNLGYQGEQMLEYFLPAALTGGASAPAGLAANVGMEALSAGTVGAAQSAGDPGATAMAAAAGATGPLVGKAAQKIAPILQKAAETQYGRALAATTKNLKAESQRIVPELLKRRVSGTLEGLAEKGAERSAIAGEAIGEAYKKASDAGVKTQTAPIIERLETAKKRFLATNDAGQVIATNPAAIAKIEATQELIGKFGTEARPDQIWLLRKSIDDIIKAGGGFGAELTPGTTKALQTQARTAIQKELNKAAPDIEALNKEFSLWKGLEKVATATKNRKEGQSGIVELGLRTGIGGGVGLLLGGGDKDWGTVGAALGAVTKHPLYRTVSAGEKARLAHALSMGQAGTAGGILSKILARFSVAGSGPASESTP